MKKLLMFMCIILLVGCGGGGGSDAPITTTEENIAPSYKDVYNNIVYDKVVREYDVTNEDNRVNIFISMGQSNAEGNEVNPDNILEGITANSNVFMPVEPLHEYPSVITFDNFSSYGINKAYPRSHYTGGADYDVNIANTATYFARDYNSTVPLYVINIAIGGTGVAHSSKFNLWSIERGDSNLQSLTPQSIHYLKTIITQLQDEGKEPYVIGVDWNQWEGEDTTLTEFEYFDTYMNFFSLVDTVMPNEYKLFLCNPTSTFFEHRERVSSAFKSIEDVRGNTTVYYPDMINTSDNIYRDIGIHYNNETFELIAEFILTHAIY